MNISIRAANEADAAVVALLGRITFTETFDHLLTAHRDDLGAYLEARFGVAKIRRSLGEADNFYWLRSPTVCRSATRS